MNAEEIKSLAGDVLLDRYDEARKYFYRVDERAKEDPRKYEEYKCMFLNLRYEIMTRLLK